MGNDWDAIISLPEENYKHGESCFISGFGRGSFSSVFHEAGINLFSNSFCTDLCHVKLNVAKSMVKNAQFCAGIPNPRGGLTLPGKDTCQGDSGGPVTCIRNGEPVLAGIASSGFGCGEEGLPGIYINVWDYKGWIKSKMELGK